MKYSKSIKGTLMYMQSLRNDNKRNLLNHLNNRTRSYICKIHGAYTSEAPWISLPDDVLPLPHQEKIATFLISDSLMYLIFLISLLTVNIQISNMSFNLSF